MDPVAGVAIASFTFLSKGLIRPVADELGRMASDQVRSWRATNLSKILKKADGKLALQSDGQLSLNPKLVIKIAELGSLEDDETLQDMWAGLIAASKGEDSNHLYVDILGSLSKGQAVILLQSCLRAEVEETKGGLIFSPNHQSFKTEEIQMMFGSDDMHALDQALDDLRRKDLIDGGFDTNDDNEYVYIRPSALALHFVARVSGERDSVRYYSDKIAARKQKLAKAAESAVPDDETQSV